MPIWRDFRMRALLGDWGWRNSRVRMLSRREYDKKFTVSRYVARETEENLKYVWRLILWEVAQCGLFHITEDITFIATAKRIWNVATNIFSQDSQPRGQEQTKKSLNMKQVCQLLETGPSGFGTMADAILQLPSGEEYLVAERSLGRPDYCPLVCLVWRNRSAVNSLVSI